MSASLGPVALAKRLSRFFFSAWTIRMDDSAIALLDPTSAPGLVPRPMVFLINQMCVQGNCCQCGQSRIVISRFWDCPTSRRRFSLIYVLRHQLSEDKRRRRSAKA
jgi:hypothetical protein